MLTERRPCVRLISACSVSCWTTIAVEDIATAPPITNATSGVAPAAYATAPASSAVMPTCCAPRPNTSWRIASMRGRENSRPSVNSRNTTPSSARNIVVAESCINPRAYGPSAMPTTR